MSYTVETIELDEYPHLRARIVVDEYPSEPEDDGQCPILRVGCSWRSSDRRAEGHVMTTSHQDHRRDARIERAWDHFQEGWVGARWASLAYCGVWSGDVDAEVAFERYLRIFHGVTKVEVYNPHDGDYMFIAYDPADWRKQVGLSDEWLAEHPDVASGVTNMDEWKAYCEGDVYGIVVEREVPITGLEGTDEDTDIWEEIDSLWGFYGGLWGKDAYTIEQAKEMLRDEASRWAPGVKREEG